MFDLTDSDEEADPLNEYFGKKKNRETSRNDTDYAVQTGTGNFCPYCGVKLEADYVFCKQCGKKIE